MRIRFTCFWSWVAIERLTKFSWKSLSSKRRSTREIAQPYHNDLFEVASGLLRNPADLRKCTFESIFMLHCLAHELMQRRYNFRDIFGTTVRRQQRTLCSISIERARIRIETARNDRVTFLVRNTSKAQIVGTTLLIITKVPEEISPPNFACETRAIYAFGAPRSAALFEAIQRVFH